MPRDPDGVSGDSEVHSITDASAAHSEDIRQRMIKYATAMAIRMVCLILVFVVDGWFKIIAVAGAVFLPWIAVVVANGSDRADAHSDSLLASAPLAEIEAGTDSPQADVSPSPVLPGELVEDEQHNNSDQEREAL